MDNAPLLMFSSKVGFIVHKCRSLENFAWRLLLQFSKYYKTLKIVPRLSLICVTTKVSPLLCKNVIVS